MLALAEDASLPLLERLKFVAIFANNLDEFFQVRVSGLQEQVEAGVVKRSPDGRTPAEQLEGIRERAQELSTRAANVFATELVPALEKERIRIVRSIEALDRADLAFLEQEFDERIFPVLTPLSVDPAHPFPYISNLSLNLAAMVRDPMTGVRRFARVKVPPLLPRFVPLPDGERFVPLETVIAAHLDRLFPGMELVAHHTFRLTRDADLEVEEDEAEDLLEAIQSVLRRRRRGANPVRLEVDETMSHEVLELLRRELDLEEQEVVVTPGLLDLSATVVAGRARPPRAEARALGPGHAAAPGRRRGARPTCSRCSGPATSSSTTPTTRSPPRSRPSSSRPPAIPPSSRSSRRCTAPRRRRARSSGR